MLVDDHAVVRMGLKAMLGLEPDFEDRIRRAQDKETFFAVCREFLDTDTRLPDLPPEQSKRFCGFGALLE